MKHFKLTGPNPQVLSVVEAFLDKFGFEEKALAIQRDMILFDVPWDETPAYKEFMKESLR